MTSVETILTGINETEKEMKENDLEESLIYNLTDSNGNVNISELSSEEVHMIDFFSSNFFFVQKQLKFCENATGDSRFHFQMKIFFTLFFCNFRLWKIQSWPN